MSRRIGKKNLIQKRNLEKNEKKEKEVAPFYAFVPLMRMFLTPSCI